MGDFHLHFARFCLLSLSTYQSMSKSTVRQAQLEDQQCEHGAAVVRC